jgi:hypothetical protein
MSSDTFSFTDVVRLANKIEKDAVNFYLQKRVPVAFQRLHPLIVARAHLESGGDWRRCVADNDGTITVYNHPMWQPEAE